MGRPNSDVPGAVLFAHSSIRFRYLITAAVCIGVGGGVLASAYYYLLELGLATAWGPLHSALTAAFGGDALARGLALVAVTTLGGLCVGVILRFMGVPGEIAAVVNNIHVHNGRLDIQQTPAMTAVSLVSITAGGSAGPEAPLVQIIGSLGSWLGDKLRWTAHVRTLTFCGMAAALGAFFGAPLGGALFALEIPHRNGLEYYEALIPSLTAAYVSYFIFLVLVHPEAPLLTFAGQPEALAVPMAQAMALGAAGALVALLFMFIFRKIGEWLERWERHRIALATFAGFAIGALAVTVPEGLHLNVLFWSEHQLQDVYDGLGTFQAIGIGSALLWLAWAALAKMAAIGFTLHGGLRGGFIFPLFFLGAVTGMAIHLVTGGWVSLPVAMLCTMSAVNVAVTRTPISSTIILTTLSDTHMLPIIGAASITSFLLTSRVVLIVTQRRRESIVPARPSIPTWHDVTAAE